MPHLDLSQWLLAGAAGMLIGISKTGVPGIGVLVVPLLAYAFGGTPSIGIMLPMLILGDCFAVAWYRRHAQWDRLVGLLPWVVVGMGIGSAALWAVGQSRSERDVLGVAIGILVLVMLTIYLAQGWLGDRLTPRSKAGVASCGTAAGFATTVSNAAGPIMSIYMTAQELPKEQFMGTIAWYFLIINIAKMPIYFILTAINPAKPIITLGSLALVAAIFPIILVGVFIGKWLLPRIPQRAFDTVVLVLAAVYAVKLIVS